MTPKTHRQDPRRSQDTVLWEVRTMSGPRPAFGITTAAQQQVEATRTRTDYSMASNCPCRGTEGRDPESDRSGRGKDGAATMDGQEWVSTTEDKPQPVTTVEDAAILDGSARRLLTNSRETAPAGCNKGAVGA